MTCPSCRRPVAVARAVCLYCGAALSAETVAAARVASEATAKGVPFGTPAREAAAPERTLVILEAAEADAGALASALQVSAYEAGQRVKRGGPQLLKIVGNAEAAPEAERLRRLGLRVHEVAERDTRVSPLLVVGGLLDGAVLDLRVAEGRLRLAPGDLRLVVRGPIAREYQTRTQKKGLPLATLEAGYRFHLHRTALGAPVEIDPWSFAFGAGTHIGQSSLLTLAAWVEAFAGGVPFDDGFRLLPPALAVAENDPTSSLGSALGAPRAEKKDAALVLDNLRQFRFYSAWRGAVERMRHG